MQQRKQHLRGVGKIRVRSSLAREKRNQRESAFISKNLEMLGENQGKKEETWKKGTIIGNEKGNM